MSLRQLPALNLGVVAASAVEVSATALAKWDETVTALAADGDTTISIFGYIGESWYEEGITAREVTAALRAIGPRDVTVNINSPGGSMFEGLAMYNAFRQHPHKVIVNVLGVAASAASLVAMAGDEVRVPKAGFLMIHNANVPDGGNRHDKREIADKLEQFDSAMSSLYADRTGLDAETIGKMMDEETFLSGEEAVAKGFADALLPADEIKHETKEAPTALRRLDEALARGERLPRADRRKLIAEITGKSSAADETDTPRAVAEAIDEGASTLRLALARLKLRT